MTSPAGRRAKGAKDSGARQLSVVASAPEEGGVAAVAGSGAQIRLVAIATPKRETARTETISASGPPKTGFQLISFSRKAATRPRVPSAISGAVEPSERGYGRPRRRRPRQGRTPSRIQRLRLTRSPRAAASRALRTTPPSDEKISGQPFGAHHRLVVRVSQERLHFVHFRQPEHAQFGRERRIGALEDRGKQHEGQGDDGGAGGNAGGKARGPALQRSGAPAGERPRTWRERRSNR